MALNSGTLADSPPAPLPSVNETGDALLHELAQPIDTPQSTPLATLMHTNDPALLADIRRWWSLTLTLVTQRAEIAALVRVMSPGWQGPELKEGAGGKSTSRRPGPARLVSEQKVYEVKEGLEGHGEDAILPVVSHA